MYTKHSSMARTTDEPTACARYGSMLGEQYSVPLHDLVPPSSSSSTAASSESEALMLFTEERQECDFFTLSDIVFRMLGFESNPMQPGAMECGRNSAAADLRLSMLSNFSTAYNIISISLSLQMMKHVYTPTPRDESLCSSALIAGMIIGQLTLGTLGDVLGRHRAMAAVMLLQVTAAFASSFSSDLWVPFVTKFSVFEVLAFWRFLLGLGCGGVYPLSATLTTESSQSGKDRAKLVALTFSFQGVGYLVVPMVSLLVVSVFGESSDFGWRVLLGMGCVPGVVLTIGRIRSSQTVRRHEVSCTRKSDYVDLEAHLPQKVRAVPVSIVGAIVLERNLIRKLLGTAGSWLLFDILFYGNTLFEPVVLSAAFGTTETVAKASRDTLIIALMALPGYYVTVWAIGKQSPRWIQLQGFFVMGILYLTIGILFDQLSGHALALLTAYGSTFFFSNYGPNATTFMLPSMTFSKACRSTLNGVSAASGKAGALIGATVFVSACHRYGQETVFLVSALLSFAGCFLTLFCVSEDVGQGDDDDNLDASILMEVDTHNSTPMKHIYSHPSIFDSNPRP
jgi:MFS transporter, PHS family, inorganic phosphate transporter